MNPALILNNRQSAQRVFMEVECHERRVARISAVLYELTDGSEAAVFDRMVKAGDAEDFAVALLAFERFCAGYPVWTFDDAQRKLERECRRYSIGFPFRSPFIRVKALLPGWGVRPTKYSASTVYMSTGLKARGDVTGALHEARSVASVVGFFENLELL